MAFKSIGQRMGFVSIADAEMKAEASGYRKGKKKGKEEGLAQGMQKERVNSEKKMNLFIKRIAKKLKVPEEELLALKP